MWAHTNGRITIITLKSWLLSNYDTIISSFKDFFHYSFIKRMTYSTFCTFMVVLWNVHEASSFLFMSLEYKTNIKKTAFHVTGKKKEKSVKASLSWRLKFIAFMFNKQILAEKFTTSTITTLQPALLSALLIENSSTPSYLACPNWSNQFLFFLIFSHFPPQFPPLPISHVSHDSYQAVRANTNMCFLWQIRYESRHVNLFELPQ